MEVLGTGVAHRKLSACISAPIPIIASPVSDRAAAGHRALEPGRVAVSRAAARPTVRAGVLWPQRVLSGQTVLCLVNSIAIV